MISWDSVVTYFANSGLDTTAINSTGAATPDGTEWIAELINNGLFGPTNAIMDYAAGSANVPSGSVGVPNGVTEAAGVSQIVEAMLKMSGTGPGKLVGWFLDDDPSVTGDRVLLFQEQGVLISAYPDLDAVVYVGDGNNATVAAGGGKFYRSSDSGGATPNIAGPYLQLPEGRGYALRGLDTAAAVDPDGASRFLGDNQAFAMLTHRHDLEIDNDSGAGSTGNGAGVLRGVTSNLQRDSTPSTQATLTDAIAETGTKTESRMSNLSVQLGITY